MTRYRAGEDYRDVQREVAGWQGSDTFQAVSMVSGTESIIRNYLANKRLMRE